MGKIYFGTYRRSLDVKGRLLPPSKCPLSGEKELYLLRGHDGCLAVYDPEGFERFMAKYMAMDFEDPEERAAMRLVFSSVKQIPVDPAGRILLGKDVIRDYALNQEVLILGVGDHAEIWDEGAYAAYLLRHGHSYDAPRRVKS